MRGFALRRLALAAFTVVLVVGLTFILAHLAPGEPMIGDAALRHADPALIARERRSFGIDRPIPEQLARYAANVARGNLGQSFTMRRSVAALVGERLPNTVLLGAVALVLSFAGGIALGTAQAARRGSAADRGLGLVALVFYSTPSFFLGLVLLYVFGQRLGWLPVGGMTDPLLHDQLSWWGRAVDVGRHLVLPALTLALVTAAGVARFQRAALADLLSAEFIRTARAKGVSSLRVLLRHGLRGALGPVVTLAGVSVPFMLAGSVLVETVFAWPGVGRLLEQAVVARDYNVITGLGLVTGVLVALANLAADFGVAWLDPRSRT